MTKRKIVTVQTATEWVDIEIEKLTPANWNYKQDYSKLLEKLKNNIKRNGQIENIIVRELETGFFEVVNGNHRLEAFKQLGFNLIKCYNIGKVSLQQAQRIAIETNETKFQSNQDQLNAILKEIIGEDSIDDLIQTLPFEEDFLKSLEAGSCEGIINQNSNDDSNEVNPISSKEFGDVFDDEFCQLKNELEEQIMRRIKLFDDIATNYEESRLLAYKQIISYLKEQTDENIIN